MYIVYSLELWAVKRNELLKKKFVLLTNFTNISSQLNYNNPDPLLKNILPHVLQPCIALEHSPLNLLALNMTSPTML